MTTNTRQEVDLGALAAVLHINNVPALVTGYEDGKEQGFELSMGMSYDDDHSQWAYDVGTYIGACVAVHPETGPEKSA